MNTTTTATEATVSDRWAKLKADPVLLERERARLRELYARSPERRERQRQTGAAWRKKHATYMADYCRNHRRTKPAESSQPTSDVTAPIH